MDDVKRERRSWKQRPDTARAARAVETRRLLVAAARELFAEKGFHGVGIRDVCDRAGFARGTLNHHFSDKEALFRAVFSVVEEDLNRQVAQGLAELTSDDVWATFRKSIQLYLDATASRTDVQRITLIDGPSVLGWAAWRDLQADFGLAAFSHALTAAMDAGRIRKSPVEPLAQLLLSAVTDASLLIANSNQPDMRKTELARSLDDLLIGLEVPLAGC